MAKVSTSISIDADVKTQAQALFADLGLDLSTAINIFLRQSIRENCIPFTIQREVPNADTVRRDDAEIAMSDDEKIDFVSRRILREHRAAFEELTK